MSARIETFCVFMTFDPYTLAHSATMSWRPWTGAAKRVAKLKGHKRKPPEPIKDWKIVRGDLVSLLSTCE